MTAIPTVTGYLAERTLNTEYGATMPESAYKSYAGDGSTASGWPPQASWLLLISQLRISGYALVKNVKGTYRLILLMKQIKFLMRFCPLPTRPTWMHGLS